jgi:hypothetical protein
VRLTNIDCGPAISFWQERGRFLYCQRVGGWNPMRLSGVFNVQNFLCLNLAVGKGADHIIPLVYVKALIHNGTA